MANLHILFELLACVVLAVTLPLVLELLTLSVAALLPSKPAVTAAQNAASPIRLWAVVPAHNEELLVAACVCSLLESTGPLAQVLVVAHNCTDHTQSHAAAAGALVVPLDDDGAGGKGAALSFGFTEVFARGAEAVLVVDADSVVSADLTGEVCARLEAGADAVQCRYLVAEPDASPRTRLMALAFLGMNLLRPLGRSRLGLSSGIFGNGFALTRATLDCVPYAAQSVVEDLEYHFLLLRAGLRVDFIDTTTVLGEMPHGSSAAATQRARWEGGRSRMRRQWIWPLIRDVLRGRLRMVEPLLDLLSLPLASGAVLLLLGLLLPVFWLRFYAVTGLLTLVLYTLASASFAAKPRDILSALLSVPGYILWKLAMLPRTRLATRRNAAWVRTERNASASSESSIKRGSR